MYPDELHQVLAAVVGERHDVVVTETEDQMRPSSGSILKAASDSQSSTSQRPAPVEIDGRPACRCRPPGTLNTSDRMWHVGYQACPAWPDMRLLHQLDDSVFLGRRRSHASFSPSPFTFLSDRFSEKSATISFSAVVSRRRSFTAPEVATRAVSPPGDVYRSRGSPWTRHVH